MKTTIVYQTADSSLPQLILECTYSYHDGEPMVMYGDNPYPGSPAGVEVESVICVDVDVDGGSSADDLMRTETDAIGSCTTLIAGGIRLFT